MSAKPRGTFQQITERYPPPTPRFPLVRQGWGPRTCTCNKFPGDAFTANHFRGGLGYSGTDHPREGIRWQRKERFELLGFESPKPRLSREWKELRAYSTHLREKCKASCPQNYRMTLCAREEERDRQGMRRWGGGCAPERTPWRGAEPGSAHHPASTCVNAGPHLPAGALGLPSLCFKGSAVLLVRSEGLLQQHPAGSCGSNAHLGPKTWLGPIQLRCPGHVVTMATTPFPHLRKDTPDPSHMEGRGLDLNAQHPRVTP